MLPNMLDLRFYTAEVSDVHMNLVTVKKLGHNKECDTAIV